MPSLDDEELEAADPAVPGLCVFDDGCVVEGLSEVRVVVDSCVPVLPVEVADNAGLDRPLDSEARLLIDGAGRRIGVPTRRGDSFDDGVIDVGKPLAPICGVDWPGMALPRFVSAECKLVR